MLRATILFLLLVCLAVVLRGGEAACDHSRLVGTWLGEVTAEDPPLGRMQDLMTFEVSGTMMESRRAYVPNTPLGPLLQGGGHGVWNRQGADEYRVRFVFLLQGAPDHREFAGAPLGTDTVTLMLTLDGDRLSGAFESEIRDSQGGRVLTVRGVYEGARLGAGCSG